MAISQRTATSGTAASSAGFTITLPTSTAVDDIIIVAITNAGTTGPNAPSGWTRPYSASAGSGQCHSVYWAQYSVSLTLSFTNVASAAAWVCNAYNQSGYTVRLDPVTNPVAATSTSNNATLPTGAPTTGTQAGDYEVMTYGWTSGATITTQASGSTGDKIQANSTSVSSQLSHNNTASLAASTAMTAFSHTLSASNTRKTGVGILLQPVKLLTGASGGVGSSSATLSKKRSVSGTAGGVATASARVRGPDLPFAGPTDDFGDGTIGSQWTSNTANGGTIAESGGTLNITPQASTDNTVAGVNSASTYNVDGKRIQVEIAQRPNTGGFSLNLSNSAPMFFPLVSAAKNGGTENIGVVSGDSTITLADTVTLGSYPSGLRFIRLDVKDGRASFDYSVNGTTWVNVGSVRTFDLNLAAVYVDLRADGGLSQPSPGTTKFDNVNAAYHNFASVASAGSASASGVLYTPPVVNHAVTGALGTPLSMPGRLVGGAPVVSDWLLNPGALSGSAAGAATASGVVSKLSAHLFQDTFDRADSDTVGGNWVESAGDWDIVGNGVRSMDNGDSFLYNTTPLGTDDYEITVDLNATSMWGTASELGILARYIDNGHSYLAVLRSNSVELYRTDYTSLGICTLSASISDPITFAFRVQGDQLTLLINGKVMIAARDSYYQTGGYFGLRTWNAANMSSHKFNSIVVDEVPVLTNPVFEDAFTRANSDTVGGAWTEALGDWDIVSNGLRAMGAVNEEVVVNPTALATRDHKVTINVDPGGLWSASNSPALGIVLRYSDSDNFYLAELDHGSNKLQIKKKAGGGYSTLADIAVTTLPSAPFDFWASVVGDVISAGVGTRELAAGADSGYVAEGSYGLRAWRADSFTSHLINSFRVDAITDDAHMFRGVNGTFAERMSIRSQAGSGAAFVQCTKLDVASVPAITLTNLGSVGVTAGNVLLAVVQSLNDSAGISLAGGGGTWHSSATNRPSFGGTCHLFDCVDPTGGTFTLQISCNTALANGATVYVLEFSGMGSNANAVGLWDQETGMLGGSGTTTRTNTLRPSQADTVFVSFAMTDGDSTPTFGSPGSGWIIPTNGTETNTSKATGFVAYKIAVSTTTEPGPRVVMSPSDEWGTVLGAYRSLIPAPGNLGVSTAPFTFVALVRLLDTSNFRGIFQNGDGVGGGPDGFWVATYNGLLFVNIGSTGQAAAPNVLNGHWTLIAVAIRTSGAPGTQSFYAYDYALQTLQADHRTFNFVTGSPNHGMAYVSEYTDGNGNAPYSEAFNGDIAWMGLWSSDLSNSGSSTPTALQEFIDNGPWDRKDDTDCTFFVAFDQNVKQFPDEA